MMTIALSLILGLLLGACIEWGILQAVTAYHHQDDKSSRKIKYLDQESKVTAIITTRESIMSTAIADILQMFGVDSPDSVKVMQKPRLLANKSSCALVLNENVQLWLDADWSRRRIKITFCNLVDDLNMVGVYRHTTIKIKNDRVDSDKIWRVTGKWASELLLDKKKFTTPVRKLWTSVAKHYNKGMDDETAQQLLFKAWNECRWGKDTPMSTYVELTAFLYHFYPKQMEKMLEKQHIKIDEEEEA